MRLFPIIPIFWMIIISILFIIIILRTSKKLTHIMIVLLLFLINLRPMIPNISSKTISNNMDILFAIDTTISMNAEDYNGEEKRLDGVKKDCQKIIEELNGARFSLLTFNNDTRISIPFTKDGMMTFEAIDIIEPIEELYARGTSLNTPRNEILNLLKRSYEQDPDRLRILIFISDGEITDDSTLKSYSSLKKYLDDGMVLGYGTEKGGKMKSPDRYAEEYEEQYLMSYETFSDAISKIDEDNLKQIAKDLDIDYIHMDKTSNMNDKIKKIKNKMSVEMVSSEKKNYDDLYYLLVFPLLILIAIDFKEIRRKVI